MTIESLARRIENAADPDRFCTAVAACLERNGGDLEGAIELAETVQMDELFERFHPRDDGGKFRNKSERMKAKHARERETRRPERKPRDTGPKSSNRQAVEQAMEDPQLREELVRKASKVGSDLRRLIDPEDIVQEAMERALNEADRLELKDVRGWLNTQVARKTKDVLKKARAKKRGVVLTNPFNDELDYAEKVAQEHGVTRNEVMEQAMDQLPEKERKVLSAYYGMKRRRKKGHHFTAAQRKAAERARKKIKPIVDEIYGKLDNAREREDEPTPSTEDVPGRPSSEHIMAPGPKRKPAETRMPEDREWRKAGVTAAAHEGKVWHRKSPERIAVKKLAKHLNLSPEQTAAIHNIVKKPAQFSLRPEAPEHGPASPPQELRDTVSDLRASIPLTGSVFWDDRTKAVWIEYLDSDEDEFHVWKKRLAKVAGVEEVSGDAETPPQPGELDWHEVTTTKPAQFDTFSDFQLPKPRKPPRVMVGGRVSGHNHRL